jgi:hypothetical protein
LVPTYTVPSRATAIASGLAGARYPRERAHRDGRERLGGEGAEGHHGGETGEHAAYARDYHRRGG